MEFNKTLSLSLLLSVYVRKRAHARQNVFVLWKREIAIERRFESVSSKIFTIWEFFFFFNKREKKLQFRDLLLFVEKSIVKRCLQIYNCYLIIIEILENIRNVTQVLLYCNYFACA